MGLSLLQYESDAGVSYLYRFMLRLDNGPALLRQVFLAWMRELTCSFSTSSGAKPNQNALQKVSTA
jgi:hypothetical protein